jgi:hypothetical protein
MSAGKAHPVRLPLSDEDLERLTADDFGKVKLTEDEKSRLRVINERRLQEVQRKAVEWARAEAPLVEELRAAGAQVLSVWDLVNTKDGYPQLIPILSILIIRIQIGFVKESLGLWQSLSRVCDGTNS